jgi:hypothetical protein
VAAIWNNTAHGARESDVTRSRDASISDSLQSKKPAAASGGEGETSKVQAEAKKEPKKKTIK